MKKVIAAALLACSLSSCKGLTSLDKSCFDLDAFALKITIQDSVTGPAKLDSLKVVGTATAYRDTVYHPTAGSTAAAAIEKLAYNREGTYAVQITAFGYKPWNRSNIVVEKPTCLVIPQSFTAKLQK